MVTMLTAAALAIGAFFYIERLINIYEWVWDASDAEQDPMARKDGVWYNSSCYNDLLSFDPEDVEKAI